MSAEIPLSRRRFFTRLLPQERLTAPPVDTPTIFTTPVDRRLILGAGLGTGAEMALTGCAREITPWAPRFRETYPATTNPPRPRETTPAQTTTTETTPPPEPNTDVRALISQVSDFVKDRSEYPQERNTVQSDDDARGTRIIINTGTRRVAGNEDHVEYGLYVVGYTLKPGAVISDDTRPVHPSQIATITVGEARGPFEREPNPVNEYTLTVGPDESYRIEHTVEGRTGHDTYRYSTPSEQPLDPEFKEHLDAMNCIFTRAQNARYPN